MKRVIGLWALLFTITADAYLSPTSGAGGTSDASALTYSPAIPGDWSPAPTTGSEALDQLAARPAGNPFDQDLNTTDSPTFDILDLTGLSIAGFNGVLKAASGTVSAATLDASEIDYTPAVPGDWNVPPSEIEAALNELAARPAGNPFDQDLNVADSPEFAGLTLTGLSGFLKATAGVIATAAVNLAADVTGLLPIANLADGTANQLIGANAAGNANEFKTIQGTSNQATVTHGAGTITIGTAQDIATGSSPTFAGATLTGSSGVLKASGGVLSASAVDLSTGDVTGVLDETNGGTGLSSYATGDILYASGSNTLAKRAAGTNGYVLEMVAGVPNWAAKTGAQSIGTIDSVTKVANGAALSGTALIMQTADNDDVGMVSIIAQSFKGLKTFIDGIVDSTLTAGRCMFVGTSGRHSDDAGCTYNAATNSLTLLGDLVVSGLATITQGVQTGAIVTDSTTIPSAPCNPVTTAQRTAMSTTAGRCVYDTDLKTVLYYDGTNWAIQGVQPNNTGWAAYTPVIQGLGSGPSSDCYYRYDGPDKLISCVITVGTTPTASEIQIGIGGSDTIGTAVNSVGARGSWFYGNSVSAHGGAIVFSAGQAYVKFGAAGTFSDATVLPTSPQNGNGIFSSGQVFSFEVRVPVSGRAASVGGYSVASSGVAQTKWTNVTNCSPSTTSASFVDVVDTDCTFASAATIGSVVTPTSTGALALKRAASVAPGRYRIGATGTIVSSFAGTATQCSFQLTDGTNIVGPIWIESTAGNFVSAAGIPSTIVTYSVATTPEWKLQYRRDSGSGSCGVFAQTASTSFSITMEPIDEVITASFKDVVTTPGITGGAPKIYSAKVSAAGAVSDEAGDFINGSCVMSGTNSATGTCTFQTAFTAAPNCTLSMNGDLRIPRIDSTSTTQVVYTVYNLSSVEDARPVIINCHGNQ